VSHQRLKIGYLMQADSVPMDVVSGPQLHVQAVVRELERRGHEVRTVAIQHDQIQWSDDLVHWQSGRFRQSQSRAFRIVERAIRGTQSRLHLPFFRLFDSYRFSDACVTALNGYDVLYERCGILSYGGLIAARRLHIPLVLELNGDLLKEYQELGIQLSAVQWRIIKRVNRLMYRRADRLVAVSENLRQALIRDWDLDPGRVVTVPNGANVDLFGCPERRDGARSRYRINDGPIIILVSSFEPWHGVDLLLEAFASLAWRYSKINLVLVGDGRLRPAMERKAADLHLGRCVVFTGKVPQRDVASLLGIADVAVVCQHGSEAEAALSPLKLFEYMAAGKAIVAAGTPAVKRIINDRVNGLLVPAGDPLVLAKTIAELIDDAQLRAVLGHAARKQAIEKHSWIHTVERIEDVLRDLAQLR
jgi:glycosyltransferase involved in cell wall biosynthesis